MDIPKINIGNVKSYDAVATIKNYEKQIEKIANQNTSGMTQAMLNKGVLSGQTSIVDYSNLTKKMKEIDAYSVYVGIPARSAPRAQQGINNAELLYIQSNGVSKNAARSLIENYMRKNNVGYSKARQQVWEMWLHEHGSPAYRIPPRPVIEPALMHNQAAISTLMISAVSSYLKDDVEGFKKKLKKIGMYAERVVRLWFDNPLNNWPPNAPSTIKAKGSDHPLIDTGELRKSITYVLSFPQSNNKGKKRNNQKTEYEDIKMR